MWQRCTNPNHWKYPAYGGDGINVDPAWSNFSVFLAEMGKRPTKKHTLDRLDNDIGYCRENCKWSTPKQQARNRRKRKAERVLTRAQWAALGF